MKKITLLIFTLMLSACSNKPSSIIIAPQINAKASILYTGRSAVVEVSDMRTQQHIVQILRANKAAELISPAQQLAPVFNQAISQQWRNQGLQVNNAGNIKIHVYIDNALVSVQQETMKYQVNSNIRLRVSVAQNNQIQTTHFNSRGTSEGPLSADVAVLERDFNQQLGKIISEVIANPDIQAFIQQ